MSLVNIILPSIGSVVLIFIYSIIIIKRAQKMVFLYADVEQKKTYLDEVEKLWWSLSMAILLFVMLTFAILISSATNILGLQEALGTSFILWVFLAIIGKRLTS